MDSDKTKNIKKEKGVYGFSKFYSNILHFVESEKNESFCKEININSEDRLYRLDVGVPENLKICKNCIEKKPTKIQNIFEENPKIKHLL